MIIRNCNQSVSVAVVEWRVMAWRRKTWWRHYMVALSASLAFCKENPPVTDGFPSHRTNKSGFDVPFDVSLNMRLNKEWDCGWFETSWHSLWHHCYCISAQTNLVATLQALISKAFPWLRIWISSELMFNIILWCLIDITALVHMVALCQTSDRPSSKPTQPWFTDVYVRH